MVRALVLAAAVFASVIGAHAQGRPVSDGWQPNELVYPPEYGEPYRAGTTRQGLDYRFFQGGSGSIGVIGADILDRWSFDCTRDAMTDKRNCYVTNHNAAVFIGYGSSANPQVVCVLGHDFPGRTAMIRVDARPAHKTNEEGCVFGDIIAEIANGSVVRTRAVKWPYDTNVDKSGTLVGSAAAIDLVTFIKIHIDQLAF